MTGNEFLLYRCDRIFFIAVRACFLDWRTLFAPTKKTDAFSAFVFFVHRLLFYSAAAECVEDSYYGYAYVCEHCKPHSGKS